MENLKGLFERHGDSESIFYCTVQVTSVEDVRSFWLKADMIHSNKSVLNYKVAIIKGQLTSEIHKVNLEKKEKRDKKCINSPGRSEIDSDSLLLCLT